MPVILFQYDKIFMYLVDPSSRVCLIFFSLYCSEIIFPGCEQADVGLCNFYKLYAGKVDTFNVPLFKMLP